MTIDIVDPDKEDVFYGGELVEAPPTDIEQADNVMHKIITAQRRINAAEAYAKKAKDKVDKWLAGQVDEDSAYINGQMAMLVPWARLEILDRKKKSIDLMEGTIGFRTKQGATTDNDKPETLQWYQKNKPEFVREETVFKLDVKAAKEFYREKGEKAPTIEFAEPSDMPFVKEL